MTGLTSITISQLRQVAGLDAGGDDDLVILSSDKSTDWELFRYPCRLDAVVIALCTQGAERATRFPRQQRPTQGGKDSHHRRPSVSRSFGGQCRPRHNKTGSALPAPVTPSAATAPD
ncbi:MAG: hypothetical protein LIO68_06405 [Rikenellaceae bacterium]|nr:hypothetical protein [Rikenellaceae bacterium]